MADTLILMVMALVVFGPRRLPQIGRQIGKLMYEFRKASNDFKFQMEEELRNAEEADRRQKEEAERQRQLAANPPAQIEGSVDSQVSESRPGAPEVSDSSDSGYPYNSTYGEITDAQEMTETTQPTIQPPATGEPVAAAWPANETYETEPAAVAEEPVAAVAEEPAAAVAEEVPVEKENAVIETAAEDANKIQETAAHNG